MLHSLLHGYLFRVFAPAFIIFAIVAILTDAPDLILWLNAATVPVFAGVAVCFAPIAVEAMFTPYATRAHWLGLGIEFGAIAGCVFRFASLAARSFGFPDVLDTDVMSTAILFGLLCGLCQLKAPFAGDDGPPTRLWLRAGLYAALVISILLIAAAVHDHGVAAPAFRFS